LANEILAKISIRTGVMAAANQVLDVAVFLKQCLCLVGVEAQ
jgi:hypothetical protein